MTAKKSAEQNPSPQVSAHCKTAPDKSGRKPFSTYLRPELAKELKRLSFESDMRDESLSVADLIEVAVSNYLKSRNE